MVQNRATSNAFSVKKRIKSFSYAFEGILFMIKSQHNVWIHLCIAIAVIISGFVLEVSKAEWCFLIFAMGFVLSAEAFNTAIEELTNIVSPEQNQKAGRIKDVAAGAVLISAIAAAIIGLFIFLPKITNL